MDELDKKLDILKPLAEKPLACPNCDNDMEESQSFIVKIAGVVIVSLPVFLVSLDFIAKANQIAWAIDEKILGTCLAGIALVMAFGFKKRED